MNKLSITISFIAIVISLFTFFYFSPKEELVYVDINKLLNGYERTADVKKNFDARTAKLKSNVDSLQAGWRKELQDYEKERNAMTEKEVELNKEILANKQQQVNNYQRAIRKQIQEEDQKITQTVINDINEFVKEYGEEHGYRIILGATGGGNIMYADNSTDLTEKVLKALNEDFGG